MIKKSPLYNIRKELAAELDKIVETGDIFFRASNAKGPFGLPFSKIVTLLTKSKYSHASIIIKLHNEPFLLEINEQGTQLTRIVDWLDWCWTGEFEVFRYKNVNEEIQRQLYNEIYNFLMQDPEYDFTFSDKSKFYCTESVAQIYLNIGITLFNPLTIQESVPYWVYLILRAGSWIFDKLTSCSLPFDQKMYFVGNEKKGMIGSNEIVRIFKYPKEA